MGFSFGFIYLTAAPLSAQYDARLMESSSVRIVAKGVGKAKASSGFLWQTRDQVITSLHAIPGVVESHSAMIQNHSTLLLRI